ncbi:hypothetical protein WR25_27062 [Diploscapter pachys]|uniref:Uncharacterized protein n=1 Tax=Diploscapter pachys TaxID=2018661 RepID=A0A2A2KCU8_9BILA|nr:hypothetical protein WR25_27062 [Diploscapter pachys]
MKNISVHFTDCCSDASSALLFFIVVFVLTALLLCILVFCCGWLFGHHSKRRHDAIETMNKKYDEDENKRLKREIDLKRIEMQPACKYSIHSLIKE